MQHFMGDFPIYFSVVHSNFVDGMLIRFCKSIKKKWINAQRTCRLFGNQKIKTIISNGIRIDSFVTDS